MAKTSYVSVEPGLENLFWDALTPQDRYTSARITRKVKILSVRRKRGITMRSLLPQIAEVWNALSPAEKGAWSSAGAQSGLNGYRLFVQDKALRIKNEMPGNATPSLLHQSLVGNINLAGASPHVKIAQLHPRSYYVWKKVGGRKGMYQPVLVTEDFSLPLEISINYSSNLSSVGSPNVLKFYARVWSSYQGVDIYTDLEIPFNAVSSWTSLNDTLSSVVGDVIGYTLYIEIQNYTGDFYFDNVKSEHSGQNWVRDPYCKDVDQSFTRAFYQIPKHWQAIILTAGSGFQSLYKDF